MNSGRVAGVQARPMAILTRDEQRHQAVLGDPRYCPNCGRDFGAAGCPVVCTETGIRHCACYYDGGEHAETTFETDPGRWATDGDE